MVNSIQILNKSSTLSTLTLTTCRSPRRALVPVVPRTLTLILTITTCRSPGRAPVPVLPGTLTLPTSTSLGGDPLPVLRGTDTLDILNIWHKVLRPPRIHHFRKRRQCPDSSRNPQLLLFRTTQIHTQQGLQPRRMCENVWGRGIVELID